MNKLKLSLFTYIFFIITGCYDKQGSETKKVQFKSFSVEIPVKWNRIPLKGIDSQINGILTEKKDTITFDLGMFSSDFSNVINVSNESERKKLDSLGFPTDEINFSKTPIIDKNQGVFHKEYYYYETIGENIGKIRVPKKAGNGVTGISFRNINNSKKHLTIYSNNLNYKEQKELIKLFKTIVFNK
ncbi:conserved hypothetical protein [Tenacibaculum maritimum]|uniref:hypothetical protein n=1 Tax=Tenacibaculum maritimum TaxID=107401 RepID=UPI0012E5340A|nr:hypothetical protein [Tenacibaculum maritimum]CAA0227422.1 conserved hypothetical protein [Tenacibaculum maritimum]